MIKPENQILFDLLYPLVREGIKKVVAVNRKRLSYRPRYFQYPYMKYWPNGLPDISKNIYGGGPLVDYVSYFESNQNNTSIILITHDISITKMANRIIFLDNGKITGIGNYNDLLSKHEKFRAFVTLEKQRKILST